MGALATSVLLVAALEPPTRIAIVGGGLAGLGTAAHLVSEAQQPLRALHVYDAHLPGEGGASAVAAGLLHPFTRGGRQIHQGVPGYEAAVELVRRVEHLSGACSRASGLLRLALSEEQSEELQTAVSGGAVAAASSLHQRWLTHDEVSARAGAAVGGTGAAYAPAALSLDVPKYLRGLWALCEAGSGEAQWRLGEVHSLAPLLRDYDAVVVALGARATTLRGCESLPLTACRGQNLVLSNEGGLQAPLISGKYVLPVGDGGARLLAGATFEYDPADRVHRSAEQPAAEAALRPALRRLHPAIDAERVVGCQAGVRALPPRSHRGYFPIAGRLGRGGDAGDGGWLLGGLGSRGLIYHALLGRAMARAVLRGDEAELPEHTRRVQSALDACVLA